MQSVSKQRHTTGWPRARVTVTTSLWKHLRMDCARSKQRHVTISRPTGLLSWFQAETSKGAFSNSRYGGWNTNFTGSPAPAQAEQAIHTCDLDRVGTKGVTSAAVKDARQRDGDEPVNVGQMWVAQSCWCVRISADGRIRRAKFSGGCGKRKATASRQWQCAQSHNCSIIRGRLGENAVPRHWQATYLMLITVLSQNMCRACSVLCGVCSTEALVHTASSLTFLVFALFASRTSTCPERR